MFDVSGSRLKVEPTERGMLISRASDVSSIPGAWRPAELMFGVGWRSRSELLAYCVGLHKVGRGLSRVDDLESFYQTGCWVQPGSQLRILRLVVYF